MDNNVLSNIDISMQLKLNTTLRLVIMSARSYGSFTLAQCSQSKVLEVLAGASTSFHFFPGTSLKPSFAHSGKHTFFFLRIYHTSNLDA